jgi:metallophosphoesterase superfamily enzyme
MIRGNHDKLLSKTTRDLPECCSVVDDFKDRGYMIHHGHLLFDDSKAQTIIVSHEHPAFVLRGNEFAHVKLPAFVTMRTKLNKQIVILPASSEIAMGNNFPPKSADQLLSPYLRKNGDLSTMQIFPFDPSTGVLDLPENRFWKNNN